jgi:uncharacterized protein YbjT (DUF2867 family)
MPLVVGATGRLGVEICARLRAGGVPVRALVRPGSPRETQLAELDVERVYADLKDPQSLATACSGTNCLVTTASAMHARCDGDGLKSVDRDGHISLIRAAKAAGVEHFVYTSISAEANPRAVLVRIKRRVERVLRESGMAWTVLQPAAFMETLFSASAGWEIEDGRVRIVGPGTTPFNPVSMYDVAEFAVQSVVRDDLQRRVIPAGGPDVVTALEAVAVFEEVAGRKLEVKHSSAARAAITSRLLGPFNPARSSLLSLAVGGGHDDVIDMALVLSEIPITLTTFRQFAEWRVRGETGRRPFSPHNLPSN